MMDAIFDYGFEYLGNSSRLVITPLTDRCYLTLTSALHLKFGGAPSGPAGTGKTETTKDLAKALAMKCVVFNCSDQLDYLSMGRFFRGLASSGSWACFDEFNRINVEVLSVIATQIATIQQALRNEMEQFYFDGANTRMKSSCAIFVTMNPGYAGRTELPDNLKILFRPVAMMIPDYSLIAEISMISFGFDMTTSLARKIVHTFKLASEQLSDQNHYDFGMRAVKTVISAVGKLKKTYPNENEESLCLKAIHDVNIPKFISEDLMLFQDILSDIFPSVRKREVDQKSLRDTIEMKCKENGLDPISERFVEKCLQIYDTTVVRHGLMIVGSSGVGKSTALKIIKDSITTLSENNTTQEKFLQTQLHYINPKALDVGFLFGFYNENTREWTDGVLPYLMRNNQSTNDKRIFHWFVMDGPVDPDWIENLNTVLDDNKKLCLANSETIRLDEDMRMIFEVNDLSKVSPATVSRCGMVFFDNEVVPLETIIESWLNGFIGEKQKYKQQLEIMSTKFLQHLLEFLNSLQLMVASSSKTNFNRFTKMLDYFIDICDSKNMKETEKSFTAFMEISFVFCAIWMAAGCTNPASWEKIDVFIRKWNLETNIPSNGRVFDYYIDENEVRWRSWTDSKDFKIIPRRQGDDFHTIRIPTVETVTNQYLIKLLAARHNSIVLIGETGTAKTSIVTELQRTIKGVLFETISLSSKTPLNMLQSFMEQKLDRRQRSIYGPQVGYTMSFFIDDLNMPRPDKYGSQPLMELLRQFLSYGGWYDTMNIGEFRNIVDSSLICAMQPPNGIISSSLERLTRHLGLISCPEFSEESMVRIYSNLFNFWSNKSEKNAIMKFSNQIVSMSVALYRSVVTTILPLPSKPHYRYNLRDLSRIFQGLNEYNPLSMQTFGDLFDAWTFEVNRVLKDRLIFEEDTLLFEKIFEQSAVPVVGKTTAEKIRGYEPLYCNFLEKKKDPIRILDFNKINDRLEGFQSDYNMANNQNSRVVFFEYAIKHILRTTRILKQEMSNALLIGIPGNGRKTLTTLAAYINGCELIRIRPSRSFSNQDWRDALKSILLKCGIQNMHTVLLLDDSEMIEDYFFEDISCLLTSGDVLNLYNPNEMEDILQRCKKLVKDKSKEATKTNIFAAYLEAVKRHLHVVLCMSPVNEKFRDRLRQYPALINLCSIDYYEPWTERDLMSLSKFVLDAAINILDSAENAEEASKIMAEIHSKCQSAAESMTHRTHYLTSSKFLEFMDIFISYAQERSNSLQELADRAQFGLDKLKLAEQSAVQSENFVKQLLPSLAKSSKEVNKMMEGLEDQRLGLEKAKEALKEEEELIREEETVVAQQAAVAKSEWRKLEPVMIEAMKSLKVLSSKDIIELSSLKSAPAGVVLVMSAVCTLLSVKIDKSNEMSDGIVKWSTSKALLNKPNFLRTLEHFDKDNIKDSTIAKVEKYIKRKDFAPAYVRKSSKACESLSRWVHAIYKYHFASKVVLPIKLEADEASGRLKNLKDELEEKRANSKQLEDYLSDLSQRVEDFVNEKKRIEEKLEDGNKKLARANKLMRGLMEDKNRWLKSIDMVKESLNCLVGESILSAAHVIYLTAFDEETRLELKRDWLRVVDNSTFAIGKEFDFNESAGDKSLIRQWHIAYLPTDRTSIENAIISSISPHWPLFIDPHNQVPRWISNMERDRQLVSFKYSEEDYARKIEICMRQGNHCLLLDVPEQVDCILDGVLAKKIVTQAGFPMIKLGDSLVPYGHGFKLYMISKSDCPSFSPELNAKSTVIDFTLSRRAFEEQLTNIVISIDQPEIENRQARLKQSSLEAMNVLDALHEKTLDRLTNSENPIDDDELIDALYISSEKAREIEENIKQMKITTEQIDGVRKFYNPFVSIGQRLFFEISNLYKINHMYRYSSHWFTQIFKEAVSSATENTMEDRLVSMETNFLRNFYLKFSQGLFERDKLLIRFLICVAKLLNENRISLSDYHFFLYSEQTRRTSLKVPKPGDEFNWLSDIHWANLCSIDWLFGTNKLIDYNEDIKKIFYSSDPYNEKVKVYESLDSFQRLILIKVFRIDCLTSSLNDFICQSLGNDYFEVDQSVSQMTRSFEGSSPQQPIFFILSQGCDPTDALMKYIDSVKFRSRFQYISLGQGQGEKASSIITRGIDRGEWIYLQNCHLSPSWMPILDEYVASLEKRRVHRDFRLILTSLPDDNIPESILRSSFKVTIKQMNPAVQNVSPSQCKPF
ncbi:hypothetical protein ACOME3_006208 [Neoechinorhynchus agilis]